MALTLAESAKLSSDMVQRGVIETIIEESPILAMMPFEAIEGNSFKYNRELSPGSAQYYAVNATWTEGTATFTQVTASLAILGGDADVDNFIQRVRSNIQDQRAVQTAMKAKAVARAFEESMIYGDTADDASEFDGLWKSITAAQTVTGDLTLAKLDETIDLVKGGKPDAIIMSRRTRRKLKALLQANLHYVERGESAFGRQVMAYDGIPVEINDFQGDAETATAKTGGALSSLYALQLRSPDGLYGLQNGSLEVIDLGQLESKDAQRVRIRWYVSMAIGRENAVARMKSITA